MKDLHDSEAWGYSCGDCGHKWHQKVAEVARWSEFEGLKMLLGLRNLQVLVISRGWECSKLKRAPSGGCLGSSREGFKKSLRNERPPKLLFFYINGHIEVPPSPKPLNIFLRCLATDPQSRAEARS